MYYLEIRAEAEYLRDTGLITENYVSIYTSS